MGAFSWFCRCVPGISLVIWILLCYQIIAERLLSLNNASSGKEALVEEWESLDGWEWTYVLYNLLTHVCACVLFPARLIYSLWHIIEEVRLAKYEAVDVVKPYEDSEISSMLEVGSSDERSSQHSATLSTTSSVTLGGSAHQDDGLKAGQDGFVPVTIVHAIILPSYKEDMSTLKETLSVLASHVLAKSSYDVYLAMEQRDPDAEWTAKSLINSFSNSFRNISFTLHPGDISGEVAGKSSNVGWAARQLSNNYIDPQARAGCVITVIDSDTHLSSTYFLLLTKYHREDPERTNTLYSVPIVFDRNAHKVSSFVRCADIFWCAAGLSGLYPGSSIKIPTSVYSIPMTLAGYVGGWDSGPESIGEDMHMYLKCYFKSRGQVRSKVIYSPASQSNVHSDLTGIRGYLGSLIARFQQAFRHMWGSLDSGYAIQKSLEAWLNLKDDKSSDWLTTPDPHQRVPRWVNDSALSHFTPPNTYEVLLRQSTKFSKSSLVCLFHRLYEAHFLPAHLAVAALSTIFYTLHIPASTTHPTLLWTFDLCGTLRFIGFVATNIFLCQYEFYHIACLRTREEEMKRCGLYEDMQQQDQFSHRDWRNNWSDYVALPVNGVLFGVLPAVVANVSHFFTDRLNYSVSAKPQLRRTIDSTVLLA